MNDIRYYNDYEFHYDDKNRVERIVYSTNYQGGDVYVNGKRPCNPRSTIEGIKCTDIPGLSRVIEILELHEKIQELEW